MRTAVLREAAQSRDPRTIEISGVRRFVEDDVPRVADLHRRVFNTANGSTGSWMDSYRSYFAEVFAESAEGVNSLVHEDRDGFITGFLGVHPRRMQFNERPIVMALCSQFAVDPTRRGQVGLRMLKQCLNGPQDLSITDESGDDTRRIWEWCGGTTALLYSIHWVRPLRPAHTAVALLLKRRSPRLARWSAPIASMADALCDALAKGPLRTSAPRGSTEQLDEATLAACLPEFTAGRSLRPDYEPTFLSWILKRARTRRAGGPLRQILVKDEKQTIAGWVLYYAHRGGIGEVLQIAARKDTVGQVLDQLIDDAWRSGVTALTGRLDPAFAQELSERYCLFYRRGYWTLIHSRQPDLLQAIERGDAFLSRLEGEWCLRFQ